MSNCNICSDRLYSVAFAAGPVLRSGDLQNSASADAASPLPYYRVAPVDGDHAACIEAWRDARRELHGVRPISGDFSDCYFDTYSYRVDGIVFSRTRIKGLILDRQKQHLHDDASGFLRMRLYLSGSMLNMVEGEPVRDDPAKISILDYARPNALVIPEMTQIGVYVPHDAIGYDPGLHAPHRAIDLASPTGRILATAIRSTFSELKGMATDDAAAVAASFTGMLRGLLGGGATSESERDIQRSRFRAMRGFLEEHLRDPTIGAGALERHFGASRATIFRDFAPYGGVAKWVQTRRLERAFADLADGSPRRGAVTAVSESWRFSSVAHFSRLFRARFGIAPNSAVGIRGSASDSTACARGASSGAEDDLSKLQSWLLSS